MSDVPPGTHECVRVDLGTLRHLEGGGAGRELRIGHDVERQFHGGAGAHRPGGDDEAAVVAEQCGGGRVQVVPPAHEEDEFSGPGSGGATGHAHVVEVTAPSGRLLPGRGNRVGVDGRVDEDGEGLAPPGNAAGQVLDHQLDVVGVGDADADHVGDGGQFGAGRCSSRSGGDRLLDRRRVEVEHGDRHADFEQASDHGRTHLAQAHVPDAHAVPLMRHPRA